MKRPPGPSRRGADHRTQPLKPFTRTADDEVVDEITAPRNLVVVRAGDQSRHLEWLEGQKEFDLLVHYYGSVPGKFRDGSDFYHADTRSDLRNFSAIHRLFVENERYMEDYDFFFFPDDDIVTNASTISALFGMHHELSLGISQPALDDSSFFSHTITLAHRGLALREVNFVEAMCPMFSKAALEQCLPTFPLSMSGWGLDWVWQALLPTVGQRAAIIDCLPVRHSRPVGGGENYQGLCESPFQESERVCADFGTLPAQQMRVRRAWDASFRPVPHRELARTAFQMLPPIIHARGLDNDAYVEELRREMRRSEAPTSESDSAPSTVDRRAALKQVVRDEYVGVPVLPSGWTPEELALAREHTAVEASATRSATDRSTRIEPGPEADAWIGRLIGARLRAAVAEGRSVSIAFCASDGQLLDELVLATTAQGIRIVVCVEVGLEASPVVEAIARRLDAEGLSIDDVDVEVREQVDDPGLELGVDFSRRAPKAPWRPGHPLAIGSLSLSDLFELVADVRDEALSAAGGTRSLATASLRESH